MSSAADLSAYVCTTCRHIRLDASYPEQSYCEHPIWRKSPVTGLANMRCLSARTVEAWCGPKGRLHQPRKTFDLDQACNKARQQLAASIEQSVQRHQSELAVLRNPRMTLEPVMISAREVRFEWAREVSQ